jgi:hypothetical protein
MSKCRLAKQQGAPKSSRLKEATFGHADPYEDIRKPWNCGRRSRVTGGAERGNKQEVHRTVKRKQARQDRSLAESRTSKGHWSAHHPDIDARRRSGLGQRLGVAPDVEVPPLGNRRRVLLQERRRGHPWSRDAETDVEVCFSARPLAASRWRTSTGLASSGAAQTWVGGTK